MKKILLSFLLVTTLLLSTFSISGVNIVYAGDISDVSSWSPVYPSNNQNDYLQDQQTASGSVSQDIVGDSTYPSTYMAFSSEDMAIRIRVSNVNGFSPYEFKNFAFIGLDSDLDGTVDFFLGIYNPTGNNGRLGIYSADGSLNVSPSTTGISGKPLMAFQPLDGVNYTITQAPGSNFNGDPDYFISFKFDVADILEALQGTGIAFSASTPFRFMTGTAAQDNSFNQDLNGMDADGFSSDDTWNELGVFSDVVSADGTADGNYYTVTFDKNTGDTEADPSLKVVEANTAVGALPSNPTKRAMYFQEWNSLPDGSGTTVSTDTIITGNTTFYAIWSDTPLSTVTFYPTSGDWAGSTTPIAVNTIDGIVDGNMPENPADGSKNFVGWEIGSTGTFLNASTIVEDAPGYDTVNKNLDVYAVYANGTNTAKFYYNEDGLGGSLVATIYSNGNSSNFNGSAPTVTRQGYVFGGWYLNDTNCAGTATLVAGDSISSAGNYYAKWTPAPPDTISFNLNYVGATGAPADQLSVDGKVGALPTEPTRSGYEFVEWNRLPDGSGEPMYETSEIIGDTTLYAIWSSSNNVNFHSNGGLFDDGTALEVIKAVDGDLSYQPQPPSRTDYTFLGWATSSGSSTVVDLETVDFTTVTDLYAVWTPNYTVTFNENYGATPATQDVLTAYGRALYIPNDPTRTGFSFRSWNTLPDGTGTEFTISTDVTANQIIYAQWNGVPVAVNDLAVTPLNTPVIISVLTNDTDPEDDTLTITAVDTAVNGTVIDNGNGTVTYTPNGGLTGSDTFTYTISDGNGGSSTATVIVYVETNAPPTAVDDAYSTNEDTTLVVSASGVLANDSDIDGTISVTSYTNPTNGTLTIYADGSFEYIPDVNYNGLDSFTYTITDDDSDTDTATVNITVYSVDETPTANDDISSTDLNTAVIIDYLTNDVSPDGGAVVSFDAASVNGGTISDNGNGTFTYTPALDYTGDDTFTYTITDSDGDTSAAATVTVTVGTEYNVAYTAPDADSGVPSDANGYIVGADVTVGSAPTRAGYEFAGWNDGTTTYAPGAATPMVSGGITFTAVWNEEHSVTYTAPDATGGTTPTDSNAYVQGDTVTINASEPTRDGYAFDGWTKSGDATVYKSGTANDSFTMPDADVTLTAQWTAQNNNVTYEDGTTDTVTGMPSPLTTSHATDSTVSISTSEPTRDGYTFGGWTTSFDANTYDKDHGTYHEFTMPASAVTLTAKWNANTIQVTYDEDYTGGASTTENETFGSNYTNIPSPDPVRSGYTFGGWYTGQNGTGTEVTFLTEVTNSSNHTLYAKWTPVNYNVTYEDGTTDTVTGMPSPVTTSHAYASTVAISASEPSRTGYTFEGWSSSFDANTYDKDHGTYHEFTMPASAVTLTAKWSVNTIQVTYDEDYTGGASTLENETFGQNYTNIPNPDPVRAGYTFGGWFTGQNGTGTEVTLLTEVTNAADHTLYAKWTAANNNVTYEDGTTDPVLDMPSPSTTSHATGSTVSISSSEPRREDHVFGGWTTSFDSNTYDKDDATYHEFTMPTSTVTLTAVWHREHNVTYLAPDATGGTTPTDVNGYIQGATVNISADEPTRDGYTFDGWTRSGDATVYKNGTANDTLTMPDEHVELSAKWTADDQTLSYDAGAAGASAANMPSSSTHATGSTATVSSTVPTWTDHDFDGWETSSGTGYTGGDTFTMGANDVALIAQWSDTEYNVIYSAPNADSGVPSDANGYIVGADVTVGSAPTRDGYKFMGWDDGTTTHVSGATTPMVSGGITLTAVWSILPDAADDVYSTDVNTTLNIPAIGVMANDTLGEGTNTVTVLTDVSKGALTLNLDGSFEYIPDADFAGTDMFTYTLTDEDGDTSTATVTIHVRSIEVTPETSVINVGEDVDLDAALTPSSITHLPVVWTSSNPLVATVDANGLVTGLDVGRVVITATSGGIFDTAIVEVQSPEPDDASLPRIRVEGDIFYTDDETPIPDIDMTLYSTPLRGTSDSEGYFYLGYTSAGTHTLTAEVTVGNEIGRIVPVTFTRGATESYVVHSDGSVDVTFTDETDLIYLRLEIPRSTGVLGMRSVNFIHERAVNPQTGDDSTWWEAAIQWIGDLFTK